MAASTTPSMRDRALSLAAKSFRVFPLVPNGKIPAITDWPNRASSDPKIVAAMWSEPVSGDSLPNNIGVACGHGFFVVDVDTKGGKPGMQSLEALKDLGLDTSTYTVRTASGGLHLYYRSDAPVKNSVSKIGHGIDVRGIGGFVVGAGSEVAGGTYEVINEGEG